MKHEIALDWRKKRAGEYPPITDLADGMAKGDPRQVEDYLARCRAVKAKYPKPQNEQ